MNKTIKHLIFIFCITGYTLVWLTPNAQAVDYPYIFGDNAHEWITNVTFGDINYSSTQNVSGYGNYTFDRTGKMTRLIPGNSYPLSVTIHPDTQWCNEYLFAFFDWNHDRDFTDPGEQVEIISDTCTPGPHAVNIVVPTSAVGGETRMRIVLEYFEPPTSSGDIPEGEAEDYTIVVDYPAVAGDNRSEWITNVTIGEINNTTARNTSGYGDYSFWVTGKVADVNRSGVYPLSITISPDTTWCNENVTAFIDWNHDGDFADAKENISIALKTCAPGPHILNLRIPMGATLGRTPMRIVLRWFYSPSPTGHISGEVEDYTLLVHKKMSPWILFIPAIVSHQ